MQDIGKGATQPLGLTFNLLDHAASLVNIHHTETYERDGKPPVVTGTGPEATDNVARQAFDWLEEQAETHE
ncbi:MAG: hypothetical protein EP343_18105 [Deltaproteobacteria bacterium]|nr:MAG: hypothetical protein EP343_18105 [Deltaproteobacteria bacterium]